MDQASRRLASYGVTGITDMTPSNDSSAFEYFARLQGSGSLLQRVCMAGSLELKAPDRQSAHLTVGATNLLYLMLRHGEAARVSSLFYLTPPTAELLGWLSYGETMGLVAMIGFAVSVAGVFLVTRPAKDAP